MDAGLSGITAKHREAVAPNYCIKSDRFKFSTLAKPEAYPILTGGNIYRQKRETKGVRWRKTQGGETYSESGCSTGGS